MAALAVVIRERCPAGRGRARLWRLRQRRALLWGIAMGRTIAGIRRNIKPSSTSSTRVNRKRSACWPWPKTSVSCRRRTTRCTSPSKNRRSLSRTNTPRWTNAPRGHHLRHPLRTTAAAVATSANRPCTCLRRHPRRQQRLQQLPRRPTRV